MIMVEAIEDFKKRRFTSNFEFFDHAFRNVDSRKTFKADDLTIAEHYRFEGASNPDHMSVVYANPALGRFLENGKIREAI